MRDSSYSWFAELFIQKLLFHGLNHSSTASSSSSGSSSSNSSGSGSGSGSSTSSSSSSSRNSSSSATLAVSPSISPSLIDARKHLRLEERLSGGGVETKIFSQHHHQQHPPHSNKAIYGGGISVNNNNHNNNHYNGINSTSTTTARYSKGITGTAMLQSNNNCNNRINSISTNNGSHTQSSSSSSKIDKVDKMVDKLVDKYQEPSSYFTRSQQFFFHFIMIMNNHRFNQLLITAILKEIKVLESNNIHNNYYPSNNTSSTLHYLPHNPHQHQSSYSSSSSSGLLHNHASRVDYFITAEDYALKVAKLKILGRFLGVLLFSHQWHLDESLGTNSSIVSSSSSNSGGISGNRDGSVHSLLSLSIPLQPIIEDAYHRGVLSLSIGWICDLLKMMRWTISGNYQYMDALMYLKRLQRSQLFHLSPSSKLSTNRLT
jgi:hypothetical protein